MRIQKKTPVVKWAERAAASWQPPPVGSLKINVDATTFRELGSGLGVVIRDHEVSVCRAACLQTKSKWNAEIAEAKAIILGLQIAIQCNVENVIIESDCLHVINRVKSREVDGSYLGVILREI